MLVYMGWETVITLIPYLVLHFVRILTLILHILRGFRVLIRTFTHFKGAGNGSKKEGYLKMLIFI